MAISHFCKGVRLILHFLRPRGICQSVSACSYQAIKRLLVYLPLPSLHYAAGYNESGVSGMRTIYGCHAREDSARQHETARRGGGEPHMSEE